MASESCFWISTILTLNEAVKTVSTQFNPQEKRNVTLSSPFDDSRNDCRMTSKSVQEQSGQSASTTTTVKRAKGGRQPRSSKIICKERLACLSLNSEASIFCEECDINICPPCDAGLSNFICFVIFFSMHAYNISFFRTLTRSFLPGMINIWSVSSSKGL